MNFSDALVGLISGKYLQREKWKTTGEYVILLPGMPHIWKILVQPNPNAGNWLPLTEDLAAQDWIIVDPAAVVAIVNPPAAPVPPAA